MIGKAVMLNPHSSRLLEGAQPSWPALATRQCREEGKEQNSSDGHGSILWSSIPAFAEFPVMRDEACLLNTLPDLGKFGMLLNVTWRTMVQVTSRVIVFANRYIYRFLK